MKRNVVETMPEYLKSSFLLVEKDIERILTKLFFENQPQNRQLLRLLVIPTKDCLSNQTNQEYIEKVRNTNLGTLIEEGYIKLAPKIYMPEHEKVKSYIIISFDNFTPNTNNTEFRDCTISFDIICHTDYWVMNDYQIRPLKIAGYIDGILNNSKLTGIGTLNFMGCNELVLDENLSGYTLSYRAIHGSDDRISDENND
jgi:hypothetical protein